MTERAVPDGHWLAGLTDGEGCFYLCATRTRRTRGYDKLFRCLTFEYRLGLRKDDIATVHLARDILGCGNISVHNRGGPQASQPNAKPFASLTVYARTDIPKVIAFFRRFPLRSKKARDFSLWAEAFETYATALSTTPLTGLSKGSLDRPSASKRRRPEGSTRIRFRSIPDPVWHAMLGYQRQIADMRKYPHAQ